MNTVFASCQATNRVPVERVSDGAKCGRCGNYLFDDHVVNATAATLDKYGRILGRGVNLAGW
ncbi:hypothetical protein BBW68_00520 [Candidatus Erwinia dacicola]|uniref:Thioredoxin 2 N-terminal domain-containing protein n=1 Tax=Candidatus Erwinia dacicola TaxID=252393 RepID=A0A1E7Z507_9GAMM|nr:hypothetical protein BBW68_00520 [Candidatus Erwinia dacicola]RAP70358.1 hypothetical protein ACZ87_02837 [Candidatus Erwinia dacicola]